MPRACNASRSAKPPSLATALRSEGAALPVRTPPLILNKSFPHFAPLRPGARSQKFTSLRLFSGEFAIFQADHVCPWHEGAVALFSSAWPSERESSAILHGQTRRQGLGMRSGPHSRHGAAVLQYSHERPTLGMSGLRWCRELPAGLPAPWAGQSRSVGSDKAVQLDRHLFTFQERVTIPQKQR